MKLSPQQDIAAAKISEWLKTDQKRFVLAGYAGTGKSTLAKLLSEDHNTHFCAYTGKAANVLREKGNDASTIHGALYKLISDDDEAEPRYALDDDSFIIGKDLVIVDEYSMLPEEIISDIESLAKKVLYLGDPFQLPPVQGECNLKPDYFLEEIHRQALESNIIKYATDVREGKALDFCKHDDFVHQSKKFFTSEDYEAAEQIIVGLNKTRIAWNDRFREKLGFSGMALPQRGDKLICTKNNHVRGLFNGMIGEAASDARQVSFQEIRLDFEAHRNLKVWDGAFKKREGLPVGYEKSLDRFDYAYAITCHKSQGSEFDNVLIFNQPIGKDNIDRRRWLYTALTRGKEKVSLVQP